MFGYCGSSVSLFLYISTDKKKMDKTFAFSYLKLMREDGSILPDGTHELFVYKVIITTGTCTGPLVWTGHCGWCSFNRVSCVITCTCTCMCSSRHVHLISFNFFAMTLIEELCFSLECQPILFWLLLLVNATTCTCICTCTYI